MAKPATATGYFENGLPYVRIGSGPRNLVIFEGLSFNHKPPSGMMLRMARSSYKSYVQDFTVYSVNRKPNLPKGYSMRDMSEDYATMIKQEFDGPVDVMGVSTGGPMAQHFAADHPELVNRLVLASTGYRLLERSAELQMRVAELATKGKWSAASVALIGTVFGGIKGFFFKVVAWLFGKRFLGSGEFPLDGVVEIEAEDKHDFTDRLAEITVPALVIGGEDDFFYNVKELADGIPNAKLILYENAGHDAMMKKQFSEDVLAFLTDNSI